MRKAIHIALLCSAVVTGIRAQSVLSTQYPLGIPYQIGTGPSLALGSTGTGVADDFFGMAKNPGNLGSIGLAAFSAVVSLDFLHTTSDGRSTTQAGLAPRLISFAFPLSSIGTFGFSLDQRTSTDLTFRTISPLDAGSQSDAISEVDIGVDNNGGTTIWQGGWGYSIGRRARLGLAYERIYFNNETAVLRSTRGSIQNTLLDSSKVALRGNGIRGGVLVPLGKLMLGFAGEYIFEGTAKKSTIIKGADLDSSAEETFSLQLPPSASLGASYRFTPEWLVAADLGMTLWNRYESGVELSSQALDNALNVSAGVQYIPAPNLLTPRYWEIMQYRAGLRYTQLPVSTASEFALDLSLGLPLQQGGGLFDIIIEAGRRSDNRYDGFAENFVYLQLGINGGRKWFQTAESSY